jgi:hypothetical protein
MKKLKLTFQALTILLDASGLLLSLFSIESIDNTRLKLIVHLCQAFRTELILLMILLFCGFYFIPFAYRHFRTTDTFNRLICISSILTAVVLFSPYAVKYAKARYYYFNNNILESHAQFGAIEKGVNLLKEGQYDLAIEEFNLVEQFSTVSKFNNVIESYKQEIELSMKAADYLYCNFVIDNKDIEDKTHKLHICSNLNPSEYKHHYDAHMAEIKEAIDNYPKLYQALAEDDYSSCQNLIKIYGDVWFENIVKDKLLHDNRKYIMELLHQYLDNEDCIRGQKRLNLKYNKK